MIDWEWESFEDYLTSRPFSFSEPGPLHAPIKSFTLQRNDELQLILETIAYDNPTSKSVNVPLGTVRINNETSTLADRFGHVVTLKGVSPQQSIRTYNTQPFTDELHETSTIYSVSAQIRNDAPVSFVIDWLANVESAYHWPNSTKRSTETLTTRTIGHDAAAHVLTNKFKSEGSSSNVVKFKVDDYDIFLCSSKFDPIKKVKNPGYILYVGNPPDKLREKVRDILSYCLGNYLVHLGYSTFCQNCYLISFDAISAYSLGGRAFNILPVPPLPLHATYQMWIDQEVLSRMIILIYEKYDDLNFGSLSWAYWHAIIATPHIAPVHYGAAIEALLRSYVSSNSSIFDTKLICKGHWSILKQAAEKVVVAMPVNQKSKKILKNKIAQLNSKPNSVLQEEVLDQLGLRLSEIEKSAWHHRHDAGHGSYSKPEDSIKLIRETKLLRIRFNRMLLAITKASDRYYDYYTLGHPVRPLADEVPE